MARAPDAGSDDAFTGRTSELRGKETDPQPNRQVGFKQQVSGWRCCTALLGRVAPRSSAVDRPIFLPCHVRLWPGAKEQVIEVARNSYCWHVRTKVNIYRRPSTSLGRVTEVRLSRIKGVIRAAKASPSAAVPSDDGMPDLVHPS